MTITVMYEARCDYCIATYSIGRINVTHDSIFKKNFVDQLRHEGWSVGRHVTCPDCVKEGRPHRSRRKFPEKRHYDTPSSIAVP